MILGVQTDLRLNTRYIPAKENGLGEDVMIHCLIMSGMGFVELCEIAAIGR